MKSGFKAGIPQAIPLPEPFIPSVTITGSSFRNTGQFITGYSGQDRAPIYSKASIMLNGIKEFQIIGNTIINVDTGKEGLPPDPQIVSYGEGIYLNYAGKGNVNKNLISGNNITQCETGLYIYNSKAQVLGNKIYNNRFGVRLFNNSQTTFTDFDGSFDPGAFYDFQIIRDNSSYQLYASNNAFPTLFIYNQVLRENNPLSIPRIYYDVPNRGIDPGNQYELSPINISCNYWSSNFDHNKYLSFETIHNCSCMGSARHSLYVRRKSTL
ncbi:MAG: DUF1565 domain-containing protein [Bacteroidetes bacterium]|nr:DUF1565 domain-containing protein [Bacteroidota bacterium]MCL2302746.1 DUF1565 domain-containing protein [Lentimicrobiaceae bacterium]